MWLAHHFPGLGITPEAIDEMTPEQTTALRKAGEAILKDERELQFAHTKLIARAAGMRMR